MKNLFILIFSALLFSCNTAKQIVAQPSVERTITTYVVPKDTIIGVKADTASIAAKLIADSNGKITVSKIVAVKKTVLPSGKVFTETNYSTPKNARALQPVVTIDDDNNLSVDCFCDTAAIAFRYNQINKTDSSTITLPPVIIEKKFTRWQSIQLWAGRIFLILLLVLIIIKLVSIYNHKTL